MAAQSPDDVTEEFMNLKDAGTSESAIVHGVITSLSPMKKGKASNFFHANISDGDTQLRLVGFQDAQRKQLASFKKDSSAIALEHCKIKRARQSDDLEVLLKPTTKVTKSPKKLDVKQFPTEEHQPTILLKNLQDLPTYTKVWVKAKVMNVDPPVKLSGGLTKQEITIADSTAPARLTLGEKDIDTLEEFNSYHFQPLTVRAFKCQKYLTTPKEGCKVEPIEDLDDVTEDDLPNDSITIHDAEIIGVQSLQKYSACISCNVKVEYVDETTGTCSKCDMFQPLNRCKQKISARLYIQHGEENLHLSAFDDILTTIAGSTNVTSESLLLSKPSTITYENNIISSVKI